MSRGVRVGTRVVVALLAIIAGFPLLQSGFRQFEVRVFTGFLGTLGAEDRVIAAGHAIVVSPDRGLPFQAVVAPSCSSLAALLAIGSLGVLTRHGRLSRRALAVGAALAAVAIGNTLRIVASLFVGVHAGSSALVLFHDLVGGAFTFAYVIGGYVALVAILLPSAPAGRHVRKEHAHAA